MEPIIITGTGRSGTSKVAQFLYNLGVDMGAEFVPANNRNPEGYFENKRIIEINKRYANGEVSFSTLREVLKTQVRAHPWGFKDPRVADFPGVYRKMFPNALIVNVTRDREPTLRSLEKTMEKNVARELYERRRRNMKQIDCITIKIENFL